MHVLYDENGNLIPHGAHHDHDHDHCDHDHEHCEQHDHCHAHETGECHDHGHHHHHHETPQTKEQMTALLDYMWKHNESHAAELDKVAGKLAENGMLQASEQVRKAVDEFKKGNMYLSLALSIVKEG